MKKLIIALGLAAFLFSCSQPATPTKVEGDKAYFGEEFTPKDVLSIPQLEEKMNHADSLTDVHVSGKIVETCAHKGCWMTIENGDAEPLRVRFKDYGFFVPKEGVGGKDVVFKGKAFQEEVSVEWQHHYIDDSPASDEEKAKLKAEITEPSKVLSFLADGVMIEGIVADE